MRNAFLETAFAGAAGADLGPVVAIPDIADPNLLKPDADQVVLVLEILLNAHAGKMHALLFREYKVRDKGRDWYDFVWYVARGTPLNLIHLEARMRQSKNWNRATSLTRETFLDLLRNKIENLNISSAREDIQNFVRDPRSLEIWSKEFFLSLLPKIIFPKPA